MTRAEGAPLGFKSECRITPWTRIRSHADFSLSLPLFRVMGKLSSRHSTTSPVSNRSHVISRDPKPFIDASHLRMREAMAALELDLTREALQTVMNKTKDARQNTLMRLFTIPSRCCRSCRAQRRLASVAQHSIDVAIKDIRLPH